MGNLLDPTESQVAHHEGKHRRRLHDRRRARDEVGLFERIREWCRGRSAGARMPLGIWFALLFVLYFYDQDSAAAMDVINASLHKLGHSLWGLIVPDTPIPGGWLMQFGVPVIVMVICYRLFDYFGIAITFAWLGTAFLWNAPYCRRAPSEAFTRSLLPMNEPVHDWHEMLSAFDIMHDAGAIAETLRWGGLLALAFGIYFLGSQLYFMHTLEERRKETERRVAAAGASR